MLKLSLNAPLDRPCGSCPYRKDVTSGIWDESEYQKLPDYDKETSRQPPKVFICHQQIDTICAGWCGTHDMAENLGLRVAESLGFIDSKVALACLDYQTEVPLFASGYEASVHGLRDIENPSARVLTAQVSILSKRYRKNP